MIHFLIECVSESSSILSGDSFTSPVSDWDKRGGGEVIYRDRGYCGTKTKGFNATMHRSVRGHPIGIRDVFQRRSNLSDPISRGTPLCRHQECVPFCSYQGHNRSQGTYQMLFSAFCFNLLQLALLKKQGVLKAAALDKKLKCCLKMQEPATSTRSQLGQAERSGSTPFRYDRKINGLFVILVNRSEPTDFSLDFSEEPLDPPVGLWMFYPSNDDDRSGCEGCGSRVSVRSFPQDGRDLDRSRNMIPALPIRLLNRCDPAFQDNEAQGEHQILFEAVDQLIDALASDLKIPSYLGNRLFFQPLLDYSLDIPI